MDFSVDRNGIVEAMCAGVVTEVGYNDDNGNYVRYKTNLVNVDGLDCFVEFVYLHASKILVSKGQNLTAGTPLIVAGNTGKSTGPHTHISAYRIDSYGKKLDWNEAFGSFDWTKYLLPYYSEDIGELLRQIWSIIIKKNI